MPTENNKRIAKNTAMLYVRMLFTMAISLYTSRVVLKTLGIADFGIYNIVGGVVILFEFLNSAMASATQRFLSFELGKNDSEEVKRVFSMSMTAHISIALLVILLAETIGLWFLNTQINIPEGRMNAANWVYQFSILTFCVNIIRTPYNASIIAYEKMSFYAYLSIVEVILKLLIVFLLVFFGFDKLILYSILVFIVGAIVFTLYKLYCGKVFSNCRYNYFWDIDLYKKLMSFSGWSLFGNAANIGAQQGINILLNIFFGVTVNAAMGIANQLSQAVYNFVSNFQTAFKPQIVKSYASDEKIYFNNLILQTSKFSYYLLFLLSLPILISCEFILKIWLGTVPEYTVSFCRLIIVFLLIEAISAPLWMAVQAIGKIRNYQILIGSIIICNIPLAYAVLKFGMVPESVLVIRLLIGIVTFIARFIYLLPKIELPIRLYIKEVIWVSLVMSLLSLPLPLLVNHYFSNWIGLLITTIVALVTTGCMIYTIGLRHNEREFVKKMILDKLKF
jgi:O-antigen/teichoic acid export membrane protein